MFRRMRAGDAEQQNVAYCVLRLRVQSPAWEEMEGGGGEGSVRFQQRDGNGQPKTGGSSLSVSVEVSRQGTTKNQQELAS